MILTLGFVEAAEMHGAKRSSREMTIEENKKNNKNGLRTTRPRFAGLVRLSDRYLEGVVRDRWVGMRGCLLKAIRINTKPSTRKRESARQKQ